MTNPSDEGLVVPELEGVPVNDEAEAADAETDHWGIFNEGQEG